MGNSRFARFFRALARPTPPRRLRVMYWIALATCAVLLILLHVSQAREHRAARLLTAAANACQIPTALPVVFVHVPPVRAAMKTKSHTHRAPSAPHKEK